MSTATEPTSASASNSEGVGTPGDVEVPSAFGRLRWWFEESPIAFTSSTAIAVVSLALLFLLTTAAVRKSSPVVSVALQAVQADSPASQPTEGEQAMEFQRLSAASRAESNTEESIELPEVPRPESTIKPNEIRGNQADSEHALSESTAALSQAGDLLKMLQSNQNRRGEADGSGGRGVGQLDPNSTPGRQARWVITYPTLPQAEYERLLDALRIELAYLLADRRTMQYLAGLAAAGRKSTGDAEVEDRMFWYWMNSNRLSELDTSILRKHGLEPTSDVVHLYPKELEKRLADLEREYLKRQYKHNNIELIAQTNFKIFPGGPGGWHLEVTGMVLR